MRTLGNAFSVTLGVELQPVAVDVAAQFCGELNPFKLDGFLPPLGEGVHYLVTGVLGGVESSLGFDSSGSERPNDWACP